MALCPKHPTYQAKRKPQVDCPECHAAWASRRLHAEIDAIRAAISGHESVSDLAVSLLADGPLTDSELRNKLLVAYSDSHITRGLQNLLARGEIEKGKLAKPVGRFKGGQTVYFRSA